MKFGKTIRFLFSFVIFSISLLMISSAVMAQTNSTPPGFSNRPEKVKVEPRGNKVKVTDVSDDDTEEINDEEDESDEDQDESYESDELVVDFEDEEEEDEDDDNDGNIRVRSRNNASYVIQSRLAAKTNFPIQVNYETRELIISTPAGEKVVTILPETAVENMLAANVLDQLGGKGGYYWDQANPSPSPSASPEESPSSSPEASPDSSPEASASPTASPTVEPVSSEEDAITLTLDEDGNLVYEVNGSKTEQFLGLFDVKINKIAVVSAETGEVVRVKRNIISRFLDSLSF